MSRDYAEAKRIFLEAAERSGEEQARYLDEACRGDAALRVEVEALLAADAGPARSLDQPVSIAGFTILRKIGEGGMGTVYEAQQLNPRRTVALKLLKRGLGDPERLRRFRYETEILGRLDHPGIARIYAAGVEDGQPWFAMELVRGEPLPDHARRLEPRGRLALVARICAAVEHAHRRGIVHRDLKPGNILVDAHGEPRLLDFGVAKAVGPDHVMTTLATRAGEILGTVPYMSPEQVRCDPDTVDARADVYALGGIAYEMLAGRLPLDLARKPLTEALRTVLEQEPATLGSLDARWRGDIETIVSKALAKDPEHRYASAGEMGADIGRFLRDEPILARPPSAIYQLRKFARRHRAIVVASAIAALALVVATPVSISLAVRERRARALATARAAVLERRDGLGRTARGLRLLEGGQPGLAREALEQEPGRGDFERRWLLANCFHPHRVLMRGDGQVWRVRTSRAGTRFAAGGEDGDVRLWDSSGRELARFDVGGEARSLDLHPDGEKVAVAVWHPEEQRVDLMLWSRGERTVLASSRGASPPLGSVRFSADGSALAWTWADGFLRVWDVASGTRRFEVKVHETGARTMAVAPDGSRIATGARYEPLVQVWDGRTGERLRSLTRVGYTTTVLAFDPTGARLALVERTETPRFIDVATGEDLLRTEEIAGGSANLEAVAFAPDGGRAYVVGYEGTLLAFDISGERRGLVWKTHVAKVPLNSVVLSRDARWLACAGAGPDVHVVEAASGQVAGTLREHEGRLWQMQFLDRGLRLATASDDGTVRLWELDHLPANLLPGDGVPVPGVVHTRDRILTAAADGTLRLWDAGSSAPAAAARSGLSGIDGIALFPDGARAALSGADGRIEIVEASTGEARGRFAGHDGRITGVAVSPDGARLATASDRGELALRDARSGEPLVRSDAPTPLAVALHPGGARLAVACGEKGAQVRDASSLLLLAEYAPQGAAILDVAYDPDGRWLACAASDASVRILDATSTALLATLSAAGDSPLGTRNAVHCLAFSRDGERLAGGTRDGAVFVWDTGSWIETIRLDGHRGPVLDLAFSPDGIRLVSASEDGCARVWDTRLPEARR